MEDMISIDLGTTNCVVTTIEDGEVRLLPNKDGDLITPTFIHVMPQGDKVITEVGKKAKAHLEDDPNNVLYSFKTFMGTREIVKELPMLGNMTALHCSYLMLKYLKESAEEALESIVTQAVITVPAYFDESQKAATKVAAKMAGLEVGHIVNEPTAATFYYGLTSEDGEPKTVMAYDFGGGTFDVSIIQVVGDNCVVLGTDGDNKLGGDDIDKAVLDYIVSEAGIRLTKKNSDLREVLMRIAERAKIELSDQITLRNKQDAKVEFEVPLSLDADESEKVKITLTREKFEELIHPIIQRTLMSVEQCIESSYTDVSELDEVIFIGGSTKIPYISKMVSDFLLAKGGDKFTEEYFQTFQLDPDLAVGLGAGIYLKYLQEGKLSQLTDIVSKTIGVSDNNGQMLPIINAGRTLPATKTKILYNSEDYQTSINIFLYEGNSNVASRNTKVGEIIIPTEPAPKGTSSVMVKVTMREDGTLKVQAVTGTEVKDVEISRTEWDMEENLGKKIKGFGE